MSRPEDIRSVTDFKRDTPPTSRNSVGQGVRARTVNGKARL